MAELKVLVVDDEPGIRSGVSRILGSFRFTYPFMDEDYTYTVEEAETGNAFADNGYAGFHEDKAGSEER